MPANARTAWRHGSHLGLHCSYCCLNLLLILLVFGLTDVREMAFVTAAITFERVAPAGSRVTRAIGAIVTCLGLFLIVKAST
jgi:predicted metal-binding membrane protein